MGEVIEATAIFYTVLTHMCSQTFKQQGITAFFKYTQKISQFKLGLTGSWMEMHNST